MTEGYWHRNFWAATTYFFWNDDFWQEYGADVPSEIVGTYSSLVAVLNLINLDEMEYYMNFRTKPEKHLSFTGSAQSLGLTGVASMLILSAKTGGCHYSFDGVATTNSPYLPQDVVATIFVDKPSAMSVIRSTVNGVLYVLEVEITSM